MDYPERIDPMKASERTSDADRDICAQHVARYGFAAAWCVDRHVIDAACGTGYGAAMLAVAGARAVGLLDREIAVDLSRRLPPTVQWYSATMNLDAPPPSPMGAADIVVSFETIEHLIDPVPFLRWAHGVAPLLIASVPWNEPTGNPHHRHTRITRAIFADWLTRAGWGGFQWFVQFGGEPHVRQPTIDNLDTPATASAVSLIGGTLIVVARRA